MKNVVLAVGAGALVLYLLRRETTRRAEAAGRGAFDTLWGRLFGAPALDSLADRARRSIAATAAAGGRALDELVGARADLAALGPGQSALDSLWEASAADAAFG